MSGLFGTYLHVSGSRSCRSASDNEKQDVDIVIVTEEVTKKVNGKTKKQIIQRYLKPLPAIDYEPSMSLDDCIEHELQNGATLLSKNLRAHWALLAIGSNRLFITTSIIDDHIRR